VSRKTTRIRICFCLPPQTGCAARAAPLKRLVAVVALRPAQRLAASQPGEDGRGDGIRSACQSCPNFSGLGARASVWTAASSAPLWSVRPPVVRHPVAVPLGCLVAVAIQPNPTKSNQKMKSRKFPFVHARPPTTPRLCLHEPCPTDPNTDGISHFKSGISTSSCGIYEHRIGIGLEDLGGPARMYLQSRISQNPSSVTHHVLGPAHPASTLQRFNLRMKITKPNQFQNGVSTVKSGLSAISAASAPATRTHFHLDTPRGGDSLSPPAMDGTGSCPLTAGGFGRPTHRASGIAHVGSPTKSDQVRPLK